MNVSIITVCFNSAATLRDTIESVLGQSFGEIEYIVVDGGSTDGSLEIIREYENRIAKVISEPDDGIYDAMNKGIAAATGKIVGILNSDDIFASEHTVEDVVEFFQQEKNVDLIFGDVVFVSPHDLTTIRRFYSSKAFKPWKLRFGYMPPHPATFVRSEVYIQFGSYDRKYSISSDYEIFVRWLLVRKLTFRRIDKVLVYMRPGGLSTSGIKSSLRLNQEIIKACRANGIHTNWLFLLPKVPFKLLEFWRKPG